MSLLCAYSDSSSSSGSDNEGVETQQQTVAVTTDLPSVDDLFSSTGSSVLSGPTPSRVATGFKAAQNEDVNKRRSDATDLRATDAKRVKATANTSTAPSASKLLARPFAPPQLKRPNVSTEDTGAWNTQTTMKHQERKQKSSE